MKQINPVLAIDWGTSNRRAWLLDEQGVALRRHADDQGILAVAGKFRESLRDLLTTMDIGRADVVMSGMVGSRNGWVDVPYVDASLPLHELPAKLIDVDSGLPDVRCRIVPGYRVLDDGGLPDVMRGEETQILGALASGAAPGWFLLPGTHSKWVAIADDRVEHLLTFMTGELYALLSRHGTLAALIGQQDAHVPQAFVQGLEAAGSAAFTHRAFNCRALVVTDSMPAEHAASWLSGLLIGCELHEIRQRKDLAGVVQIVGSANLTERYDQALRHFGMQSRSWQPEQVHAAAVRLLAAS